MPCTCDSGWHLGRPSPAGLRLGLGIVHLGVQVELERVGSMIEIDIFAHVWIHSHRDQLWSAVFQVQVQIQASIEILSGI